MKVIIEPKVTIVGQTHFNPHPKYEIPDDGTDIERLGAFSAKSCYDSFGKDRRSCIENQREIIGHRHGSVLEHSYATLFVEGVTRALTLEMNRHRLLNISQRSTRYTKEDSAAIVLEPYYADIWKRHNMWWDDEEGILFRGKKKEDDPKTVNRIEHPALNESDEVRLLADFIYAADDALKTYQRQVALLMQMNPNGLEGFTLRKWARGKARNILPHCLETRCTYTANMREWRWFIEVRSGEHAEPEIRRLADHILYALKPLAPVYFEDFKLEKIHDNIPVWKPEHHKV